MHNCTCPESIISLQNNSQKTLMKFYAINVIYTAHMTVTQQNFIHKHANLLYRD